LTNSPVSKHFTKCFLITDKTYPLFRLSWSSSRSQLHPLWWQPYPHMACSIQPGHSSNQPRCRILCDHQLLRRSTKHWVWNMGHWVSFSVQWWFPCL